MRVPPAVPVALAFAAGILTSAALPPSPLLVLTALLVLALIQPLRRTTFLRAPSTTAGRAAVLSAALVGGNMSGHAARRAQDSDCRWGLRDNESYVIRGRFLASVGRGSAPFRMEHVSPGPGCVATVRARLGARAELDPSRTGPGLLIEAQARWTVWRGAKNPERAGTLVLSELTRVRPLHPYVPTELIGRLRGAVLARVDRSFGASAPTVEALILARKERLDPEVREAYARSGVAHLLAISGFHVGVVAALLAVVGSWFVGPRTTLGAVVPGLGVWAYVMLIGAPPAAVRAAAIGTVLAASRLRGRPTSRRAGLATVLLAFLVAKPLALYEVGFQLSFAGAGGLVFLAPALERLLAGVWPDGLRGRGLSASAVSLAATLSTTPVVAWHFGELPLLGIPMTAVLTPLVAASIVGALAALALGLAHPLPGALAVGGTDLLLETASVLARAVAGSGWVVVGAGRPALIGGMLAAGVGWLLRPTARDGWGEGGARRRSWLVGPHMVGFVLAGVVAGPVAARAWGGSSAELVALDVGQGDAILIKSPAGRWILIDAGPAGPRFDAGASRVVPYLESRGAERLEVVLLTHADLDHFGGARAVLEELEVAHVLDPGLAASKTEWRRLLEVADDRAIPWTSVDSTLSLDMDGLRIEVWRPPDSILGGIEGSVANAASLITVVRFGSFAALLTGDAPVAVEDAYAEAVGDVDVLKVGHHGSRTSTSDSLLVVVAPEVALLSVGRRNRYGHPHRAVLDRLGRFGVRTVRTDLDGTIRVRFEADGRYWIETG